MKLIVCQEETRQHMIDAFKASVAYSKQQHEPTPTLREFIRLTAPKNSPCETPLENASAGHSSTTPTFFNRGQKRQAEALTAESAAPHSSHSGEPYKVCRT